MNATHEGPSARPAGPTGDGSQPLPAPVPSSDHSLGPGWWLASDGRWYPPTATSGPPPPPPPSALPTTPPPPFAPAAMATGYPVARKVSRGVSGTAQGFLWAAGAFSVFVAIVALGGVEAASRFDSATSRAERQRAFDDMLEVDDGINGFLGLHIVLALVVFILMVIMLHQAHRASDSLMPGERGWTSGWTIGAWFIPVAQFVIPKLVISEIERIASAPRLADGRVDPSWRQTKVSGLGVAWWLTFVPGVILATVGNSMFQDVDSDQWSTGYWCLAIGHGLLAASAVCCIFYLRRIVRALG